MLGSVKQRKVQSLSVRQQEERSSKEQTETKGQVEQERSLIIGPTGSVGNQKSRSIAGKGSYPEPGQALDQVPTEIKHSDKSAWRIRQPDPTAPPADRQSVQVAQEDKKRRQHSAQDTSDVPQQFHLNSVSKPRKERHKQLRQNHFHRIHPDHLDQPQEPGITYP